MVQVGYTTRYWSLWDKHNLWPAALGCVHPVETSTSLYNLYVNTTEVATCPNMQLHCYNLVEANVKFQVLVVTQCLCSAQSGNLHNLKIALRILRILRLRTIVA